jgi:hypothetical protein
MSATVLAAKKPFAAPAGVAAGILVAITAWLVPVNLKSVSPALLRAAGEGTPTLAEFGRQLVDAEKIGPAGLVLAAARTVGDPGAGALDRELARLVSRQPTFAPWGGWDPFLDPLFNLRAATGRPASTPVMTFFIADSARAALLNYLSHSGSLGVQALLRTRALPLTGRLPSAVQPGGQPLDALILLTGLLYQGQHLSDPLQRELHTLAETALAQNDLGDLGTFYVDLLALSRRLDWAQLSELLRRTDSTKTVAEYAQLARVAPDQFPLIYSAALFTASSDRVALYLLRYGKTGAEDLRLALASGEGAVQQLILRGVPVNRSSGPALSSAAALVLAHPRAMLVLKYLGYFFGAFLILRGLDRWIVAPGGVADLERTAPEVRAGVLAVFLAGLLIIASEPFLLQASASNDYQPRLHLPMLVTNGVPPLSVPLSSIHSMNTSTLVTIGIFAVLQVVMYFICLQKINQIDQQDVPPLLKLRLMENEDNLFDCGLYVGMMGTAAALVLQVLGVIDPNLLAAYSSNLFGLLCVALVKIRHVRGFKRRLILEQEARIAA